MVNCELDVNFDKSKITKTSIHILINGLFFYELLKYHSQFASLSKRRGEILDSLTQIPDYP